MIPQRLAPVAFGFVLSGLMSLIVSGLSTVRTVGLADGFFGLWMGNWAASWLVAFPVVLVVAPLARRIVGRFTAA